MERQKETVSSSRSGNLYNLIFQMSNVDEQHTRTSKKIFSVIATIGGYVKAFGLFLLFYKPFLERKYYIELINHLYHVEEASHSSKKKESSEENSKESQSQDGSKGRKSRLLSWAGFANLFKKKLKKEEESGE